MQPGSLDRRLVDQIVLNSERDRLGATADAELAEDVADMEVDGGAADDQLIGDNAIAASSFHQREYVEFARAQAVSGAAGRIAWLMSAWVASGASVGRPTIAARIADASSIEATFLSSWLIAPACSARFTRSSSVKRARIACARRIRR
jgi:hypothetical protein